MPRRSNKDQHATARQRPSSRFQLFATKLLVEKALPLLSDFLFQLPAGAAHFREFLAPFVRPRRVDNRARAVTYRSARTPRVERATPATRQSMERLCGIGTAAERPQKFLRVGDIYIV